MPPQQHMEEPTTELPSQLIEQKLHSVRCTKERTAAKTGKVISNSYTRRESLPKFSHI